jgi:hypothetical protein
VDLGFGGELDEQGGAAADGAGHVEPAAERLDAVAEPGQPRSPGRVGAATALPP